MQIAAATALWPRTAELLVAVGTLTATGRLAVVLRSSKEGAWAKGGDKGKGLHAHVVEEEHDREGGGDGYVPRRPSRFASIMMIGDVVDWLTNARKRAVAKYNTAQIIEEEEKDSKKIQHQQQKKKQLPVPVRYMDTIFRRHFTFSRAQVGQLAALSSAMRLKVLANALVAFTMLVTVVVAVVQGRYLSGAQMLAEAYAMVTVASLLTVAADRFATLTGEVASTRVKVEEEVLHAQSDSEDGTEGKGSVQEKDVVERTSKGVLGEGRIEDAGGDDIAMVVRGLGSEGLALTFVRIRNAELGLVRVTLVSAVLCVLRAWWTAHGETVVVPALLAWAGGGVGGELEEVVSWSSRRLWGMGVDDIAKKVLLHVLATLT